MSYAMRIDIAAELAAAERGECLLCRIESRHPDDSDCRYAKEINAYWDRNAKGLAHGDWVQEALDHGWWDCPVILTSYLQDMEHDLKHACHSSWDEELAGDIFRVRRRIADLERVRAA